MRTLFLTFCPALRALNAFRAVKRAPSLTINPSSFYTRFLLYDLRRLVASLATRSILILSRINISEWPIILAPLVSRLRELTIEVGELSRCLWILVLISVDWDNNSVGLLGVFDCHPRLLTVDPASLIVGVRSRTSSFDNTASGSNGTSPAPRKPPSILLFVIAVLKAALKHGRTSSLVI